MAVVLALAVVVIILVKRKRSRKKKRTKERDPEETKPFTENELDGCAVGKQVYLVICSHSGSLIAVEKCMYVAHMILEQTTLEAMVRVCHVEYKVD